MVLFNRIGDSIAHSTSGCQNDSVCHKFFSLCLSLCTSIKATPFIDQVGQNCNSFSGLLEIIYLDGFLVKSKSLCAHMIHSMF